MTPTEITTNALALGITPSAWPEFWTCGRCQTVFGHGRRGAFCNCLATDMGGHKEFCNLPDPLSDDPRACLWEPFYMRALGWPGIKRAQLRIAEPPIVYEVTNIDGRIYPTGNVTAALYAAWLAKGARG